MAAQNLDALFITEEANLYYFTGYPTFGEFAYPRPSVFVLPLERDPVLIFHDTFKDLAAQVSWLDDIRVYYRLAEIPVDLVKQVFEEIGCVRGRVGAEIGQEQHLAIPYRDFVRVQDVLSGVQFVDAAGLLWALRMVKSDKEVATITEACAIQDVVFQKCFKTVQVGMTQGQIANLFRRAVADTKADFGFQLMSMGAYNPYSAKGTLSPDTVFARGDMLWVDLGVIWHGYHTDYCRAVTAGKPRPDQAVTWAKVQEIYEAGRAAARPGKPISHVYRAELSAAKRLGVDMSSWRAGRYGHGIGLHTTEPPYVNLYDDTVLEPGMTICIEPGLVRPEGNFVREEMVVVTGNGCRELSHAPWELVAI